MNNKIVIVLKNKNGKFEFSEISELVEDNAIEISGSVYNKLAQGEDVSIKEVGIDPSKNINLVFDKDALVKSLLKTGVSEEQAKKNVEFSIKNIGSNMEDIAVSKTYDLTVLDIKFLKKEKVDTETQKRVIDVDSIDPDLVISNIKKKVIAQDKTVSDVVRNIYNYQLIVDGGDEELIQSKKSNILLDGPTGTGKTYILKNVAKEMDLPIIIKPATMYTTTGYEGVKLQDMLVSLLKETNGDLEAAERGIIVLDEFDKLGSMGNDKDNLEIRKAVQQDLLTYIEGGTFNVEYNGKTYDFDTSKVTFVCLGAFTDMREEKQKNLDANGNYVVDEEDYINAGIMREIVGRFKLITSTKDLSVDDMVRILKESSTSPLLVAKNNILNNYHRTLICEEDVIRKIAEVAYETNTGARGLNRIIQQLENELLEELQKGRKTAKGEEIYFTEELIEKIKDNEVRRGRTK